MLYSNHREFIERTTRFIADGLAHGDAVLTVVDAPKITAIRAALGSNADRASFADMSRVGRNPALIIQAWRDFVAAQAPRGRAMRGIGEPITAQCDDATVTECQIHESLLDVAFADDLDFWLVCPYDTASLAAPVVDHAVGTHPLVRDRDGHRLGGAHRTAADAGFAWPLPEPDHDVETIDFDARTLGALRRFVRAHDDARHVPSERIDEFVAAVSEIATNAIVHGGGGGAARMWAERGPDRGMRVVCEVTGPGRVTDPLVGRLRPTGGRKHGHGIWLANHFCDLVQIRSTDQGTTVRMHVRTG